ncbi:PepSY domain-containing protein [Acidimangrovimonas pyrenivorans]|uniref:PepSY domain-containing protein n=1 Tax=Acidimangrovimonas pyrenivorans TaxID=2030798 RepID=A0ABV7AJS8_9RHOB
MMRPVLSLGLALALAAAAVTAPARADDDDHDRARDALKSDQVMPLAQIMTAVETKLKARVIKVEFEDHNGGYRYEFELIDPHGKVSEVTVDARTGKVVGAETGGD